MRFSRRNWNPPQQYDRKIIKEERLLERIKHVRLEDGHDDKTKEFLDSLAAYCERNGGLTEGQHKAFCRIESAFTAEAKAAHKAFLEAMTEDDWKKWRIAVEYYHRTRCYHSIQSLADKAFNDPVKFKPTEAQFRTMTKNAYAVKIIENTLAEPLYEQGAVVLIRPVALRGSRGVKNYMMRPYASKPCVVVDVDIGPVLEARRGAKRYRILPFGSSEPFEVTESDIKRYRKPKEKNKNEK